MSSSSPLPQKLDALQAFSAGCDLWIMANPTESQWARKVDWYLNFQIMKSSRHQRASISETVRKILREAELDEPPLITPATEALMVASQALLPNKKTVVLPYAANSDFKTWIKACHGIWQGLNHPATRIFLPDEMMASAFDEAWPKAGPRAIVQIVSDPLII